MTIHPGETGQALSQGEYSADVINAHSPRPPGMLKVPANVTAAMAAAQPAPNVGEGAAANKLTEPHKQPLAHSAPAEIAIGLVEDDPNVRAGVQRVVAGVPGWRMHVVCASLGEARAAPLAEVQMLLLDIGLPDGSGLSLLPLVPATVPVLVISAIGDEATVVQAIEQGAAGYLLKDARPKDLIEAIVAVLEGGAPISPSVASYLLRRMRGVARVPVADISALEHLTPRETDVLRALTRGYSYEETGNLLGISRNTVGQHVKQIYAKLAVNSRSEAVFQAIQAGWLTADGR